MQFKLTHPPPAASLSNSSWRRPVGFFLSGTIIFLTLTQLPVIRFYVLTPLAVSLAWLIRDLLSGLGEPVYQLGTFVVGPAVTLEISPACTGLYQVFFLCMAILSWPAARRQRLAGISWGTFFLILLNIFRIISIYYSGLVFPSWIPFLHDVLWESIMILMVPVTLLIWMRNLPVPLSLCND